MSTRFLLITSIIFSLLQGTFLPPVFAEGLLVLFLSLAKQFRSASLGLFLGGIIFDLLQNQTLGQSSLLFLALGGLFSYLANSLPLNKPLFLAFFASLVNVLRTYILFGTNALIPAFITFAAFYIFFWIALRSNFSTLIPSRMTGQIRIR